MLNNSFCSGGTAVGSTNWQVYTPDSIYVDVNTSSCGYLVTPRYFTSLGGNSSHWISVGATALYQPTATGFRVYVNYTGITPAQANSWGWQLNWLAVGNPLTVVRKYYYAGSQRVAMRENDALRWLLSDHLGSTAVSVNGTTEAGETRYRPFGMERYSSGQTLTSYKYTGQRAEAGLGLYYYGARWYDPALGRFIQPDTIVPNPGDAQSFDRYAYVNNNPLKYRDPTGHCGVSAIAGPPGLLIDLPCWGSGVGEAVAATVAGVALAPAAANLAVNYVLSEEPLAIPPLYPELAPDAPQGSLLVTIPVPSSTTLVSGVPLLNDDTLPAVGSAPPAVASQQVLADPLLQEGPLTIYASSVDLHYNMQSAGITRPPGSAAHHIVAQNDSRATIARVILAFAGIGIDDAVNGVYLPANANVVNTGSAVHSRVHTADYYREVTNRLVNAGAGGILSELQSIATELQNGTFPY